MNHSKSILDAYTSTFIRRGSHASLRDMLEAGTIWPSQSPWCNAMVLVQKKDGSLQFCIDFRQLNMRTKKDSYPLPRIQEALESMAGAAHFSTMDFKSGFWQVRMAPELQQYTTFTVGNLGFYEFTRMPFRLCNVPVTSPASDAEHTGRVEFDPLHHLLGRCYSIWPHRRRTPGASSDSIGAYPRVQSQVETLQVLLLPDWDSLSHTSCI